jgi:hypothetical protein
VRVVCANTLGMAETEGRSRWATVNHLVGAKVRLVEAAQHIFEATCLVEDWPQFFTNDAYDHDLAGTGS